MITPGVKRWLSIAATIVVLIALWWIQAESDTTSDPSTRDSPSVSSEPRGSQEPSPGDVDPESGLLWVALADLPPEAADTAELIESGGPFPEDRDGITFENRDHLLPEHPRGYYREYTVPTPGSSTRGARRIVAGEQGEWYWTEDHYDSFSRILR